MTKRGDSPASWALDRVRVGEAMHPGVIFCMPPTPLSTIARIMADRRMHSVVVSDLDMPIWTRRWGVVSDVDLLRAIERKSSSQTAGDIAQGEARTVGVDETLSSAAHVMWEHGVTHLVAVEDEGRRAVGVISSLDIAGVLAGDAG